MKSLSPIFIHSLFRSGSTYLFNVFRRSPAGYWCYQEPVHEIALIAKDKPDELLTYDGEKMAGLRHPRLDTSYFFELYQVHASWKNIIAKEIIYDTYFDQSGDERLKNYLEALIISAKDRPVIQECRTSSRIATIKEMLGGHHIYLWRNPWDQWWSYKVDQYFDLKNFLILNASPCPELILRLRKEVGFEEFHSQDIFAEFSFFDKRRLSSENNYLLFYALWFLGLFEGISNADLLINIDALSDLSEYRQEILEELYRFDIIGLDFDDCHVAQTYYSDMEMGFFSKIEDRVHGLLRLFGYSQQDIDTILELRKRHEPSIWQLSTGRLPPDLILENATRARDLVLKIETRELNLSIHYRGQLQHALNDVTSLRNSVSWRITKPLRWIVSVLPDLSPDALKTRAKTLFYQVARYVMVRPRFRDAAVSLLDLVPAVKSRLDRILLNGAALHFTTAQVPVELASLSPHARQIYAVLKAAIGRRQKETG
jgi:hypothetical protein